MEEVQQLARTVPWPTSGVDPRVSLATAIHAGPGVYTVLVGSGMSSSAGIPTGRQILQDLVRKVALAEGVRPDDVPDDPIAWWQNQGRPEPRYDELMAALASTPHARQALLRTYFDRSPDTGSAIAPTEGHEALAALCVDGRVRVVVTTNFDHLIERAIAAAGVEPQVIWNPRQVPTMVPLPHADATVIKLHGDYRYAELRNTSDELANYPPAWQQLLGRIFDEYGLLVVGWSAEHDTALRKALESAPSRRYPTFWASHREDVAESARRLIAQRRATLIRTAGADEFLSDLRERVARLDQIALRRGRPTLLRTCTLMENESSVPPGWGVLPLLRLRTAAAMTPVPLEECDIIRPQHRRTLLRELLMAPVTSHLRSLAARTPASALADPHASAGPAAIVNWDPTPGASQSTTRAFYRLGGDATSGVSALVGARLPGAGSGAVIFTLDAALSLDGKLRLGEIAGLFRDAVLLTTVLLPTTLSRVLPAEAAISRVELHLQAATQDGTGRQRSNDVRERVDLGPLGESESSLDSLFSYAARVHSALSEREAAELVAEGIQYMVLDSGYLEPDAGLTIMRQELGLGRTSA